MFSQKAIDHIERKKAGLYALLDNWAGQLESEAKDNASWQDRTGHARQGIHSGVERSGNIFILYLAHGVEHGIFLEEGTGIHGPKKDPYIIKPKNKKALAWHGAAHPVKDVVHPGIKAQPIIGPTLDANISRIKRTVLDYWED